MPFFGDSRSMFLGLARRERAASNFLSLRIDRNLGDVNLGDVDQIPSIAGLNSINFTRIPGNPQ
jgi:hypothetical protein